MTMETTALEQQGVTLAQRIELLQVVDPGTFAEAAELAKAAAGYIKRVEEVMDPIVAAAHQAHKVAVVQRDGLLRPALRAKRVLGERLAAYEQAEAARRREQEVAAQRERERREREAREAAEAETRRLQAAAETQRLTEAAALEAQGDRAGADQLLAQPIEAPVVVPAQVFRPTPPTLAPKAAGVSFRSTWKWRLVDAGRVPAQYLQPDEKAISAVVRALGSKTKIPGIEVYEERIAAVRGA